MQTIKIHINRLHKKNVTTDSDPALDFDAKENDKLNSNEEENDDPLNEY